jgi:hypothetical protein
MVNRRPFPAANALAPGGIALETRRYFPPVLLTVAHPARAVETAGATVSSGVPGIEAAIFGDGMRKDVSLKQAKRIRRTAQALVSFGAQPRGG